jgi:FKBP-type peptidyl-prolyl cis-trans isomerase FklB
VLKLTGDGKLKHSGLLAQTLINSFVSFIICMRLTLLIILTGVSFCLTAQTAKQNANPQAVSLAKLVTREDSVQYALGMYFSQWALQNGFIRMNPTIISGAINDVMTGKKRPIKDSLALPMIKAYQVNSYVGMAKAREELLFTSLKDKPGVGRLPSGVQYVVQKAGKGAKPSEADSVIINFKGLLADGTLFEDTYARKVAISTTPASVFPGLGEALQMMPQGSIWELYIPSSAAYGDKGNGGIIPPHSALVILVELVSVKRNS